jgi:HAD superfamily hydrolase (TIGR01509 family)
MTLKLPTGTFKAYLFDCDGTIVDSMPQHNKAWSKMLAEWNCPFSEELFYAWGGMAVTEVIIRLNETHGLHMPPEDMARRKEEFYLQSLPELQAIPEVLEHIEASYGKIPFAVVSGSTRDSVMSSLETVKLLDKFDTLVCAGDYQKSKPDPEPFLIAAKRLGVAAADCLVFEDAEMGIQSAIAAGMASVKIPQPSQRILAHST